MTLIIILSTIALFLGAVTGVVIGCLMDTSSKNSIAEEAYNEGFKEGAEQMYNCVFEMIKGLEEKKHGKR